MNTKCLSRNIRSNMWLHPNADKGYLFPLMLHQPEWMVFLRTFWKSERCSGWAG